MDWFKIRKGVCQGFLLSLCLLNLHAKYIMWHAQLDEAQAGIKTDGGNKQPPIFRWYHSNGREWREPKEPLNETERREWKASLKLSIQKAEITASSPIISWQTNREKVETVTNFIFLSSKSLQTVIAAMKLKGTCRCKWKKWKAHLKVEEKLWQT